MPVEEPSEASGGDLTTGHDSASTITERASRGAMALALRMAITSGLSFLRTITVARWLGPEELGVFGMALVVLEATRAATNLGPRTVFVRLPTVDEAHVHGLWWLTFAQCMGAAVLTLASGAVLHLTGAAQGIPLSLFASIAAAALVTGLMSTQRVVAERDGHFQRSATVDVVTAIADTTLTIALAWWLRTSAALGLALLARATVEVAVSYVVFPYRPRWASTRTSIRDLLISGGSFVIVSLSSFAMLFGDNLVVGAIAGSTALGYYLAAYRLAEFPFAPLVAISHRVNLTLFSRLQHDRDALHNAALPIIELGMVAIWVLALGLASFATPIVTLAYGSAFAPAAAILVMLVPVTVGRGLINLVVPLLQATGAFAAVARLKLFELVAFMIGVTAGVVHSGATGAAAGAAIAYVLASASRMHLLTRSLGHTHRTSLRLGLRSAVPAAVGALGVALLPDLALGIRIVVFGGVAMLVAAATHRPLLRQALRRLRGHAAAPSG